MTSPEDSARARPMLCCGTVLSSRLFGKRPTLTRFRHLTQHFSGRQQQAPVSNRTRASGRNMSQDTSDHVEPPPWFLELERQPGVTDSHKALYWEDDDQVHGDDTIMKFLHTSKDVGGFIGPAVLGARVLVNSESKTLYGIWPLGRFVCGHQGITHGGMTSLAIDEMSGQAYVHFFLKERGPGFTANLSVNYKAPIPALTCVLLTVTVESVEGRKIWFTTRVTDGPEGTLFAEAKTLFVVARRDGDVPSSTSTGSLDGAAVAAVRVVANGKTQ